MMALFEIFDKSTQIDNKYRENNNITRECLGPERETGKK